MDLFDRPAACGGAEKSNFTGTELRASGGNFCDWKIDSFNAPIRELVSHSVSESISHSLSELI